MNVSLISMPSMSPDVLNGYAASLCYASEDKKRALLGAMGSGHASVAEHSSFSFYVEGVSRALLAQLTRHRIASFSVQSQRYVSMADGFDYVIPPSITALGEEDEEEFIRQMETMHAWYCQWQKRLNDAGIKGENANQDARFVLPNACCTSLLVTMNARELLHFFELRCCNRAQWEIRDLAWRMLKECKKAAPMTFKDAGPACLRGKCPEGMRSCGKPYERETGE